MYFYYSDLSLLKKDWKKATSSNHSIFFAFLDRPFGFILDPPRTPVAISTPTYPLSLTVGNFFDCTNLCMEFNNNQLSPSNELNRVFNFTKNELDVLAVLLKDFFADRKFSTYKKIFDIVHVHPLNIDINKDISDYFLKDLRANEFFNKFSHSVRLKEKSIEETFSEIYAADHRPAPAMLYQAVVYRKKEILSFLDKKTIPLDPLFTFDNYLFDCLLDNNIDLLVKIKEKGYFNNISSFKKLPKQIVDRFVNKETVFLSQRTKKEINSAIVSKKTIKKVCKV